MDTDSREETFFTLAQLKRRDWTDSLVCQFLGEPDETRPNPRYKNASPMRLYCRARVRDVEATGEFVDALAVAKRRRQSARIGAKGKRERLLAAIQELCVSVRQVPREEGKTGRFEGYYAVKQKVLAAIAEGYPWLADECARQQGAATAEATQAALYRS